MASNVKFIDADGKNQEVELGAEIYREAADNQMTVPQYLNRKYPTDAEKHGTAFEQFMAGLGMFKHRNDAYGIRPPSVDQIVRGESAQAMTAGVIIRESNPASRILFPAVLLEAIENQLKADTGGYVSQFDKLVAVNDTVDGDRVEHPVLNFSRPAAARSQGIAQLALPASMLSITVSDVSKKIPTFSLGMEISDQAKKATSLDFVALATARQAETERAARVDEYIAAFLAGDADVGYSALSTTNADVFDTTITADGQLTHKAWIKFLRTGYRTRHIDWVFCDLDAALAIENRTGKPVVTGDNPTSNRIDALAQVANPQWQGVKIFLMEDGVVPANTIMGIDSRYAIRRIRNSQAEYQAVEQFVLRRSEVIRFDFGEIAYRMFDDAFDVLTLLNS
jgi:hypothetical protein